MLQQESSLADVQAQKALADLVADAIERGFSRVFDSPIRTRQVNVPNVQQVAGQVNVMNFRAIEELLRKTIIAIYETEREEREVQQVEVTNQQPFPNIDIPETIIPPFPEEMRINNLDEITEALVGAVGELLASHEQKPFPESLEVRNLEEITTEIVSLQRTIKSLKKVLEKPAPTVKVPINLKGVIDSLENLNRSVLGIPVPVQKPPKSDQYGNPIMGNVYDFIPFAFDAFELLPAGNPTTINFYRGGLSGTLVSSVALNFLTAGLSTVVRT